LSKFNLLHNSEENESDCDSEDANGVDRVVENLKNHAPNETANIEGVFNSLDADIRLQRRFLPASELESFDCAWGMDPTGEYSRHFKRSARFGIFRGKQINVADSIRQELNSVQLESSSRIKKLEFAADEHVGLEILHLFVLDILGRSSSAARIFQSKSNEDFALFHCGQKCSHGVASL
jgi:hypothetical protein